MEYSLKIKPYNEYWANCLFNTIFSILNSCEPSYQSAALLNDYNYIIVDDITPEGTEYKYLKVQPMFDFENSCMNNLFLPAEEINFKDDANYPDYLKSLVRSGKLVMVGVDLFSWLPDHLCWQKHHWTHYALINGFCERRKIFSVLDDNMAGYGEHEVPEDRFITSVNNAELVPHALIINLAEKIPAYTLTFEKIRECATRIIDTLESMELPGLWELSQKDFDAGHMCDLLAMYNFQIIQRMVANRLFFQKIHTDYKKLKIQKWDEYCVTLQKGWKRLRNKLVKLYYSDSRGDEIRGINAACQKLFSIECEMWKMFLKEI